MGNEIKAQETVKLGEIEYSPSKLAEYEREFKSIILAEDSLYEFVKQAWPIIFGSGKRGFIGGWHIEALCEHLEAVAKRDIFKLLCNIPPRMSKSSIVNVMFPCWWWIHDPSIQFLCATGVYSLAERDSLLCQSLIQSSWYQNRWGSIYQLKKGEINRKKFVNTLNGTRQIVSTGGSVTGCNADARLIDDPNDATQSESEARRTSINNWYDSGWVTRANDYKTVVDILIMQRLHQSDLSGHVMSDPDWVKFILPMEFEEERRCKTLILPSSGNKVWEDPRKKEGELLCPERIDAKEVKKLKTDLRSEYRIAGQFQQSPSPGEGGLIKGRWFSIWKENEPPKCIQIIQSWDTALSEKDILKNSYSACTTWGLFEDDKKNMNIILLSMWRDHVNYPDLRKMAQRLYQDYRDTGDLVVPLDRKHIPNMVLIEDKASGSPLIMDLRQGGIPVVGYVPRGDKEYRVQLVTHLIESGRVWLQGRPPFYKELREYAKIFRDACVGFPNFDSRDLVDTMTQVLLRVMSIRGISNPTDRSLLEDEFRKPSESLYGVR